MKKINSHSLDIEETFLDHLLKNREQDSELLDRKIEFPNPNEAARLDILSIHSKKMNLTRGINLSKISLEAKKASGAELKAICKINFFFK